MRRIAAGEFKARCLRIMDEVANTGEPVAVTKRGREVVRVVPAVTKARPLFGRLAGTATHIGDIVSPVGEPWDADGG